MNVTRMQPRFAVVALLAAGLAAGVGQVFADSGGRTGDAQSSSGCSCHGSSATAGVSVGVTGPKTVLPSSTNQYTVTVTGGPVAPDGGFDLKASGGTLLAGPNDRVSGLEVTHSNSSTRTWRFLWKAPATTGTQNFWAVGLAANGTGGTGGDAWNFYGGAVSTAYAISVSSVTAVGDAPAADWLAPPLPNPCVNGAVIAYSLASAADVRLVVMDAAGRLVRTLVHGVQPAGRGSASWDGRTAGGTRAPSGMYFAQLSLPGRVLSTRVTVIE